MNSGYMRIPQMANIVLVRFLFLFRKDRWRALPVWLDTAMMLTSTMLSITTTRQQRLRCRFMQGKMAIQEAHQYQLSASRQWVKSSIPSGKTYDDISFPIAFARDVYQIIPADWDTANITTARGYSFTIVDNKVTLTGARITTDGQAGYYKALIIGV